MMGVCIEDESTVTISSHGINRPKGAKFLLNGFCSLVGVSANKLMGNASGLALDFTTTGLACASGLAGSLAGGLLVSLAAGAAGGFESAGGGGLFTFEKFVFW